MTTAPTTAPPRSRRSRLTIAVPIALVIAAGALLAFVLMSSSSSPATGDTVVPATSNDHRGAGDPCTERYDTGGGFLEGLGPANRCGAPSGSPWIGGRLE